MKFIRMNNRSRSALLMVLLLLSMVPSQMVLSAPAERISIKKQHEASNTANPRPKIEIGDSSLSFPASPTDSDLINCHVFLEPLAPSDQDVNQKENKELATAILKYLKRQKSEDVSALTSFLQSNPKSRWTASLALNVAQKLFDAGYLNEAADYWEKSWNLSKDKKDPAMKMVANSAVSHLVQLEARLGLAEKLEEHLRLASSRVMAASDMLRLKAAQDGLWTMNQNEGIAFKCGPYGLKSLALSKSPGLQTTRSPEEVDQIIKTADSTKRGTNLEQLKDLARKLDLDLSPVKRKSGSQIPVPSLVHWSKGHFAAILEESNGFYKIEDPTFDSDGTKWVSAAALNAESDGYFMIPSDKVGANWITLDDSEARNVWGKGYAALPQQFKTPYCPKTPCAGGNCKPKGGSGGGPDSCGMPVASAFSMNATLNIVDTPLTYSPPVGPEMGVVVNYNYNEGQQPSTFSFTNLGHNWSLNWLSYLTIDSTDPIHRIVNVRVRGGGYETYKEAFNHDAYSLAIIAEVNNAGVISWERRMPDGSVEKYERKNAAGDTFFLTQVLDPQGKAAVLAYSSNTVTDPGYFRLASITDACGNSPMTVAYDSNISTDPGYYKVTGVTDGFGRSASFAYSADKSQLLSMTDAVGNQSSFRYQTDTDSTFINLMVSPYGSTQFYRYTPGGDTDTVPEGLKFTLPDGTSTRIENWLSSIKQTYFWDREASEMYPNDAFNNVYTHCQTTRWLFISNSIESSIPSWTRKPLEAPVNYYSVGQSGQNATSAGGLTRYQQIAQQLVPIKNSITVGGTVTAGNLIKVQIRDLGLIDSGDIVLSYQVVSGDTISTIAAGLAQSFNNDRYCQGYGITAAAVGNVITVTSLTANDFDSSKFANLSGSITETLTFASGTNRVQNFSFSGTPTAGQVYAITVTDSSLPGGSQTVSYTVQAGDSNSDIAQALSLAVNANTNLQTSKISSAWTSAPYSGVIGQIPAISAAPMLGCQSSSTSTTTYASTVNGSSSVNFTNVTSAHGLVKSNYKTFPGTIWGNPIQVIDELGRRLEFSYASNQIDVLKVVNLSTSPIMGLAYYTYGSTPHKPTMIIDGTLQHTLYSYNSLGQLTTLTDPTGAVTTYNYDANGYLTSIDGPLSGNQDVTSFSFYGYGVPSSITDSEGYVLNFSYDGLNRLTTTSFPDGTSEETKYNRLDAVMMSDRIGRWTQRTYDNMQNLVSETDPLGRQTKYCWCHCGGLASLTDPAGNTTKWHHDLEGRVIQKEYADGSHYDYVYETTNSRIASISDAIQPTPQTTLFAYNFDDSVAVKRYANAVNATSQVVSAFDPYFDRPQSISNGWGQYNYKYYPNYQDFGADTGWTSIVVGGIPEVPNATDTISIVFYSSNLPGGQYTFNYTVPTGDVGNPAQLATHLGAAIGANATLQAANIFTATSGVLIKIHNQTTALRVAPTATGGTIVTCGAGKLSDVTNSVISNSQISYGYDNDGRTNVRLINGGNNNSRWSFDEMGRVTSELNPLGTFNYAYIDNTSGSSKGVNRLASITYPNSQVTNFSWLPNIGDQRLQQISNLSPTATTLSKFAYAYNSAGEITQWQQLQNSVNTHLGLAYDNAGQLITAVSDSGTQFKAYVAGTPHTGDVVSVTAYDASLTGTTPVGQETASYTVVGGDTSATIATNLASAITSVMGTNLGLSASASGKVISITTSATRATQFTSAVTGAGATDTIIMDRGQPSGNRHSQLYYGYDCAGNRTGVQGDSTGSFGTGGLSTNATAYGYNNLNELTNYAPGGPIRFEGTTTNPIISAVANVTKTVTVTGSVTTGDKLTVSVHDPAITAGKDITYTVAGGNTTTDIATGLKNLVNADGTLSSLGITATSSSNVLTITSTSANKTMYSASKNTGATETLTLNTSASDTGLISPSNAFSSNPKLALSSNTVKVTAKSGGGTAATNSYPISINSGSSATLQYDANGNMTSDGTNTYAWDAENRLIQITYPGSGNNTQFSYDALSRATKIEERTAGSVTSTKQHLWCGSSRCEERDAAGSMSNGKQFFGIGQANFASGTPAKYFYTRSHDFSVREMTDNSAAIVAQYGYEPYGKRTKLQGASEADVQYAAMYMHPRSGLSFTHFRQYDADRAIWLSRDPISSGYGYAANSPVNFIDPIGLKEINLTVELEANCLGYATYPMTGDLLHNPRAEESLSDTLGRLGYSCFPISSAKDCKCDCPSGGAGGAGGAGNHTPKLVVGVYTYESNPPNADPWSDPWIKGPGNDFHAVREDAPGNWSYVPRSMNVHKTNGNVAEAIQVSSPEKGFPGRKLPKNRTFCCCGK